MLWEAISNSRKSVSLHIQTLQSWLNKLSCASFFKPISQCLDIWWNTLPLVWYSISTWKVNMGFGSTYSLDRDLCAGLHCPTLDQLGHEVHCLDKTSCKVKNSALNVQYSILVDHWFMLWAGSMVSITYLRRSFKTSTSL